MPAMAFRDSLQHQCCSNNASEVLTCKDWGKKVRTAQRQQAGKNKKVVIEIRTTMKMEWRIVYIGCVIQHLHLHLR